MEVDILYKQKKLAKLQYLYISIRFYKDFGSYTFHRIQQVNQIILFLFNKSISQKMSDQDRKLPETYNDLIELIGGKGKYQYILSIIFALCYFVTGTILMSTAFNFNNPEFDCSAFGLLTDNCYDYVCSLPTDQWSLFVTEESNSFKSLANSFGHYFCDDEFYLNLYSSSSYLGTLIGILAASYLADNYGRKMIIIVSWAIGATGCLLLMLSSELWMASLALFLCGFGSDTTIAIATSTIAECYNDNLRQRHTSIIQCTFTIAAIIVTWIFYIAQDWVIVAIYVIFIPSAITMILILWFVKESPMYLIMDSPTNALKELNQIGYLNKKQKQCLTMADIQNVMVCQQTTQYNKSSNFIDVFRYKSLRVITIAQAIINMSTFIMYYGPTLIVSQFGFDIYTSQTVLNIADLLCYFPLMVIIDKVKRKNTGIILFLTATFMSFILIFVTKPEQCDFCAIAFIQLALVFIFRFSVSMEFAFLAIYTSQLYPIRVRNISGGVLSIFGTASSTTSTIIMGAFTRAKINHFILFAGLGLISAGCYSFCPQTLGKLCPQEIEEIQYEKHQKMLKRTQIQGQKLHVY